MDINWLKSQFLTFRFVHLVITKNRQASNKLQLDRKCYSTRINIILKIQYISIKSSLGVEVSYIFPSKKVIWEASLLERILSLFWNVRSCCSQVTLYWKVLGFFIILILIVILFFLESCLPWWFPFLSACALFFPLLTLSQIIFRNYVFSKLVLQWFVAIKNKVALLQTIVLFSLCFKIKKT